MLSRFEIDAFPENRRHELIADVSDWFTEDKNASVHSAARCLLTSWNQRTHVEELEASVQKSSCCDSGHWFVDKALGGAMVRVDVVDFVMGTDPPTLSVRSSTFAQD